MSEESNQTSIDKLRGNICIKVNKQQETIIIKDIAILREQDILYQIQRQNQAKKEKQDKHQQEISTLSDELYDQNSYMTKEQASKQAKRDIAARQKNRDEANARIAKAEEHSKAVNKQLNQIRTAKRQKVQRWAHVTKPRIQRTLAFLVVWLMGSLLTAILIMPFSIAAGSNFLLLAILGLIESSACSAFWQEYTISQKYNKLKYSILQTNGNFWSQIDLLVHNWKKNHLHEK